MAIKEVWEVKKDFTKSYTITVDELNPPAAQASQAAKQHQPSVLLPIPLRTKNHLAY